MAQLLGAGMIAQQMGEKTQADLDKRQKEAQGLASQIPDFQSQPVGASAASSTGHGGSDTMAMLDMFKKQGSTATPPVGSPQPFDANIDPRTGQPMSAPNQPNPSGSKGIDWMKLLQMVGGGGR